MVVPVPGSASEVSRLGLIGEGVEALSFNKVVSLEAFSAVSVFVSFALVRDGHANLVSVEGPSVRAGEADLVVPVPGSASQVRGLGSVSRGEDALSLNEVVSGEAGQAVS